MSTRKEREKLEAQEQKRLEKEAIQERERLERLKADMKGREYTYDAAGNVIA